MGRPPPHQTHHKLNMLLKWNQVRNARPKMANGYCYSCIYLCPIIFTIFSQKQTVVDDLPQTMNYILDLWLAQFLSLNPSTCSSPTIILYLNLLHQPQWYEATLALTSYQCIIFHHPMYFSLCSYITILLN